MKTCKTCAGGCCRAFHIPITGFDILRIMRTIDIDPYFFCGVQEISEDRLKDILGKVPLFLFTDSGEPKYYELFMKRISSKYYPGTVKCIFLHEWDATEYGSQELEGVIGRCGIYDCRPLTCRTFPAKITDENELFMDNPYFEYTNPENTKWQNHPYGLCPTPVKKEDYSALCDSYLQNLLHADYERKFFLKLSEKWNKNPDVSDNFIKFLETEYEHRLPLNNNQGQSTCP